MDFKMNKFRKNFLKSVGIGASSEETQILKAQQQSLIQKKNVDGSSEIVMETSGKAKNDNENQETPKPAPFKRFLTNIEEKKFKLVKSKRNSQIGNPPSTIEENKEQIDNSLTVSNEEPSPKKQNPEDEKVLESFVDPKITDEFQLNFIQTIAPKTGEEIRNNFLKKLAYQKIWTKKPKSHQTVVIFDWDDTLLCTSYLNPTGYIEEIEIPAHVQQHLRNLEEAVCKILELAIDMGQTFIITNAAPGWVEFSADRYLPKVTTYLKKITVISARGEYEHKFPGNVQQWKLHAFLDTEKDLNLDLITNLVALGDSNIEMDAAHHLATRFKTALIKTVKFRENPSPDELVKQLNLVSQKFSQICSSVRNLTIRLERKYVSQKKD